MWNERQRLIRNSQENAETWRKIQLKKGTEKWNSDKKENISENSDKEKYKWKNDKIMKRPNAPWERRGVCKGKTPQTLS